MRPEELATHQTGPALSFLGALFITTSAFIFILIGRWMLLQVLAKVRLRGEAVVEWQDEPRDTTAGARASVWDSLDRHLHDSPADVLVDDDLPFGGEHEADVDLSEDNDAYAVNFMAWETQCADLGKLAEQLGERAQ